MTATTTPPGRTASTIWRPAGHVRTVITPHATVLIDYRTGQIARLRGPALAAWRAAVAEVPAAVDGQIAAALHRHGWLEPADTMGASPPPVLVPAAPASWGTRQAPAALSPPGAAPVAYRAGALVAVLALLAIRHAGRPSRQFSRLLRLARLGTGHRPATTTQITAAVHAAQWAARYLPARVACLEESVTACALLAATGRRATWCHGLALDPIRPHAWLSAPDGTPVAEPPETRS
jgi:Transglutaminase-like superfamily